MRYEMLSYQVENNVMIIRLPAVVDYHTKMRQLADELFDVCRTITSEKEVHAVVVNWEQNEPPATMTLDGDGLTRAEYGKALCHLAVPVACLEIPVIASVHGYAVGQALELALACDIRIVSDASYFGMSHIHANLMPWDGGTQRLPRLVGKSKAIELILTGEMIDAQEALQIGLVNRVVDAKDLQTTVTEMALEIVSKGATALKYAKEAVHKGLDLTLEQGLRLEADLYFLLHTTQDRTERIKAFQEKRKTKFKGK